MFEALAVVGGRRHSSCAAAIDCCVCEATGGTRNHSVTTARGAQKNKCRGYKSENGGRNLEVSGVREEWPPGESGAETEN